MNIAIIPARGGSKRIKKKNISLCNGRPLLSYPLSVALESGLFETVYVYSDCEEIKAIAKECGADVSLNRDDESASDHASITDAILECLPKIPHSDCRICMIYPTAVTLRASSLRNSLDVFNDSGCDSVLSVTRYETPIERALKVQQGKLAFAFPEHRLTRTQDLEVSYRDAAQFAWSKKSIVLDKGSMFTDNTLPYVIDTTEVVDIDDLEDLRMAELKRRFMEGRDD